MYLVHIHILCSGFIIYKVIYSPIRTYQGEDVNYRLNDESGVYLTFCFIINTLLGIMVVSSMGLPKC